MSKEELFVLHLTEDGEIYGEKIPDFDAWMKSNFEGCHPPKFLSELPRNLQEASGYLLVRGHIVVPKPVQMVTKYEIE